MLRTLTWSSTGGIVGGLLGVFGVVRESWGSAMVPLLAVFGWALAYGLTALITELSGRAAQTLYAPSGRSTPRRREYSLAESLVARGLYAEAIDAFEEAIAEDGSDPVPYLKIARIRRDRTHEPELAEVWLKKALRLESLTGGQATVARRELLELYEKMGTPERAAPMLSRTAEEHAGTNEGEWASAELRRIKEAMSERSESE